MEALQNLGLLDHQGIIRCARYIELEQADLDALKKSIRFFEAAMPQFDEQGRSLLTAMSSLCSRLACEVIIVTPRSAEVADKKAEGGHTEQANCDRMMILNLVPTKLSEVISKNESKLDKAMVDGTRIDSSPANRKLLQPENIKAVSESGFKMDGLTKDDKMLSKMESNTGGNVEAKAKEAATVFIFMEPNTAACTNLASICWNKLIKVLSSCTKFAFRAMKVVARDAFVGWGLFRLQEWKSVRI
ncbi:uncharacterized protein LOC125190887 isoform X2 [Salvia hispanica]|uniref:uncharacterized protein LOC125190887 isoform X2 n=1 Tax=Salvia hispanica TaxID=49212 RepID=UPI0020093226|nr:uncharacterized protein LOC125190887 isoform X2 [Salvia hispanica]